MSVQYEIGGREERTYDYASVVSRLCVIPAGDTALADESVDERVDDCGAERFDPHYKDN